MFKGESESREEVESRKRKEPSLNRERFKRQIDLILEADKLKKISRRTTLLDVSRQENSVGSG